MLETQFFVPKDIEIRTVKFPYDPMMSGFEQV
jgi:hypothetical protein